MNRVFRLDCEKRKEDKNTQHAKKNKQSNKNTDIIRERYRWIKRERERERERERFIFDAYFRFSEMERRKEIEKKEKGLRRSQTPVSKI